MLDMGRELLGADDAYERFLGDALLAEIDFAVGQCKQRVIRSHADVIARAILRAALTHDDVPGED